MACKSLREAKLLFAKNTSGQAALIFGLAALPMMAGAGVAIDFSRLATKHTSLQQATDATALAIAREATASTTNAQVLASAQNYITTGYSNRTATITSATISSDHSSVCVSAQDNIQLGVMGMFGSSSKVVTTSTCTGIAGHSSYEVALVLDNSGSMNNGVSGSTKLAALKTAANNFTTTMFSGGLAGKVKLSIVPFSGAVAVSSTDTANGTASWIDTQGQSSWHWKTFSGATAAGFTSRLNIFNKLMGVNSNWAWAGCFETQPYPQNVNDTAPSTATPDSLYVPYLAPDEVDGKQAYQNDYIDDTPSRGCSGPTPTTDQGLLTRACKYKHPSVTNTSSYGPNGMCVSQPLLRMASTQSTLTSKINGLSANGDTNLHEGFMWGWRTISPNAPFSDGRPYDTSPAATNQKVIVLMTDGFNNWSAAANTWGLSNYEAPGYFTLANGRMPPGNQNITSLAQSRAALDELTLEACTNAKAKGIDIYTVGFTVSSDPIDSQGKALLQNCATDSAHAYIATDATSLADAFKQIGAGIGKLRIRS